MNRFCTKCGTKMDLILVDLTNKKQVDEYSNNFWMRPTVAFDPNTGEKLYREMYKCPNEESQSFLSNLFSGGFGYLHPRQQGNDGNSVKNESKWRPGTSQLEMLKEKRTKGSNPHINS